jgi:porin
MCQPARFKAVAELNYTWEVNAGLTIHCITGWIVRPGGSGRVPGIWAPGMQLDLSF